MTFPFWSQTNPKSVQMMETSATLLNICCTTFPLSNISHHRLTQIILCPVIRAHLWYCRYTYFKFCNWPTIHSYTFMCNIFVPHCHNHPFLLSNSVSSSTCNYLFTGALISMVYSWTSLFWTPLGVSWLKVSSFPGFFFNFVYVTGTVHGILRCHFRVVLIERFHCNTCYYAVMCKIIY